MIIGLVYLNKLKIIMIYLALIVSCSTSILIAVSPLVLGVLRSQFLLSSYEFFDHQYLLSSYEFFDH